MSEHIKIALIYGSAREGRFCDIVAGWIRSMIFDQNEFEIDSIDPREFSTTAFPGGKENDAFSGFRARIDAADAFIIVTPEYNHGYPAALKQLIDSAYTEWNAKPVAFVSYGGMSGGIRAVEQLRQVFAELHAVSIRESVIFPNAWNQFDNDGRLLAPERAEQSMRSMMAQLKWWTHALRNARRAIPYREVSA